MRVEILDEPYAQSAASMLASRLRARDGTVNLGLAGGSTPKPVYESLAGESLEWERVDLWLSDERWVPHDHPDSNGMMVEESLASKVTAEFHRPRWSDRMTAADSAAFYEATIRGFAGDQADVVLLGMGDDGHIASLFPGTEMVSYRGPRLYVANEVPKLQTWRLTATHRLLTTASEVFVLVTGEGKAEVLAAVVEDPEAEYPARMLADAGGEVTFLVDEAAASVLRRRRS